MCFVGGFTKPLIPSKTSPIGIGPSAWTILGLATPIDPKQHRVARAYF
jgi:hypothetical protein